MSRRVRELLSTTAMCGSDRGSDLTTNTSPTAMVVDSSEEEVEGVASGCPSTKKRCNRQCSSEGETIK